ncbi:MAG: biotin--[acetyl-CoA-carboxylase] ligase [Sellimonas intestinalis]
MSTRESILALFEEHKGVFFSGEEIAAKLSVSRAAVWKAVNSLRKDGYEITAVSIKVTVFRRRADILSAQGIRKYLIPLCGFLNLNVLPEVESTNGLLREWADAGKPEGSVVIANLQTKGRGRFGRSFHSPADTGIYLSILLRPEQAEPTQASKITTIAAVAACEAVELVSNRRAQIKWVNDIYLDDRKISGILTEASVSMETGSVEYVILGIGMNIYVPEEGFPEEIRESAGAIFDKKQNDGKNHLAAEFLNRFLSIYQGIKREDYVEEYRRRSLVVGREIIIFSPKGERKAVATRWMRIVTFLFNMRMAALTVCHRGKSMSDFFDYRQPDGRNPETIRIFFIKCSHPIDFGKYSCYIINRTDDDVPRIAPGYFQSNRNQNRWKRG